MLRIFGKSKLLTLKQATDANKRHAHRKVVRKQKQKNEKRLVCVLK